VNVRLLATRRSEVTVNRRDVQVLEDAGERLTTNTHTGGKAMDRVRVRKRSCNGCVCDGRWLINPSDRVCRRVG
jgi:hypothetical protein